MLRYGCCLVLMGSHASQTGFRLVIEPQNNLELLILLTAPPKQQD